MGFEPLGIHVRDRAESCYTVDAFRDWGLFGLDHDMEDLCHDCVDHVLNHFWPYFANLSHCFPDSSLKKNGVLSICAR